ncbi:uncharacterized protein MELLADRAFT_91399 [Melampsora larici-populina 98AG31]|uniref:Uncharacterized protein n=1 Tax=Melampsora larici-populina (strain 98AG31 / pathotype 3-4-7) TaxID=747676 RepID=F4RYX4_MELLP|nr:uncharacterized protein MELLADRAFT_91399 [Melampsora larici-populina 98AG31]EGG02427.1 hypothetical protein MELLADRAFT_91399 [Melampsora larici-populina 98AG31]
MSSLISSPSNSQKSNQTFNISFFTTTKLNTKNQTHPQPSKRIPRPIRSINSSISKLIFSPKLRHRFTNFVFFVAFSSSCLCVGFKSCFPNYGFHSNSNQNPNQESTSSSSSFDMLRSLWKSSNSLEQHHHLPIYQNSIHTENKMINPQKQRRWIEEQSP